MTSPGSVIPAARTDAPFRKGYTRDTHRTVPPGETLARVRPHLPTLGITRVANVTGLDRIGIPVVMVSRPNSRSVSVAQGKGLTLEAAKASGVMEALETWHAERVSQPLRHASQSDLESELPLADVARLPRVRRSRFAKNARILWIEGTDLVTREGMWLPYEMVHTDYTHPPAPGHGYFHCSSNGLASGNDFTEAACHAICEVVERDATTLWHHLRAEARRRTRLSADTVDDPACVEGMERLTAAGMAFAIFETTSDIAVASFRCVIVENEAESGHIGIGDGCHPDRGIALLRALTEAVQTRLTYISGARDDLVPDEFTRHAIAGKHRFVRETIDASEPLRSFQDVPDFASDSFGADLDGLTDRLREVGCEQVLAVDLTRPEIGVPVVRVVIPGLEAPHDDDSYVPGPRAAGAGAGER